jgi:hypothetical protein
MFTMMHVGMAPKNFREVDLHPEREEWMEAVAVETSTLQSMGCFGPPQELPQGFKATTTSFLFVVKPDGRKKARLVYRYSPFTEMFQGKTTIAQILDKAVLRVVLYGGYV